MKRLLMPLSGVAFISMLWGNATPAEACSGGFASVEEARAAIIEEIDLVIIGAILGPSNGYVEIEVEAVYKGPIVDRVILDQPVDLIGTYASFEPPIFGSSTPSCTYMVRGDVGERYFLVLERLSHTPAGTLTASAFSVAMREANPQLHVVYTAAQSLPAGGGPPGAGDAFPALAAAVFAVLGAGAFLAGAAFVWRRGESDNG